MSSAIGMPQRRRAAISKSVCASRPFFQTRKAEVSIGIRRIYPIRSASRDYGSQRVERTYGSSIEVRCVKKRDGERSCIVAIAVRSVYCSWA
jgi:hypothetical protein